MNGLLVCWALLAASPPAPLDLATAIARAEAGAERFALADEQLARARLLRQRAWAAVLPVVTAQGTLTRADREVIFGERVIQKQDALAGTLQGVLTVLRADAIPGLVYAHHAVEAAVQRNLWARNELGYEVARAYFAVLTAESLDGAARHAVQAAEEHLAAVRARRAAGEALGVDETRAQLAVVTARGAKVRAESGVASARDYLAFLVGADEPVTVAPWVEPLLDGERVWRRPLAERADLKAAACEVSAARSARVASWLEYLPTLSVVGTVRGTENTGFSGEPFSWSVQLAAAWTIFDAGLREATLRERASLAREATIRQREAERAAEREQRQAERDYEVAQVSRETAAEALRLAQESRSMVLQRYQAGLATSLELVEADETLERAEVDDVIATLDVSLRRLDRLRAVGLDPLGEPL